MGLLFTNYNIVMPLMSPYKLMLRKSVLICLVGVLFVLQKLNLLGYYDRYRYNLSRI